MCHLHVRLAQQFNEKGEGFPLGANQEAPDNNDEEDDVVIIMIMMRRMILVNMMIMVRRRGMM